MDKSIRTFYAPFIMQRLNLTRCLKLAGLIVVGWVAVVMLFALQLNLVSGWPARQALRLSAPLWTFWLLFAPITIGLALRFPYGQGRNLVHAVLHLACCLMIVFTSQLMTRIFIGKVQGSIRSGGPPPWVRIQLEPNSNSDPTGSTPPDWRTNRSFSFPVNLTVARSTFDVLIFWTLISSGQAYTSIRRAREKEHRAIAAEASAKEAQLLALQSQLNPHFLFNSMNAITTLVHTDPDAADEMLTDLSGLLRASLESKTKSTISLREELQLLDHYLDIEKRRFDDRLIVLMEVSDKAMDIPVPTFILQPLVENAIRHGIERSSSEGSITIDIALGNQKLKISIHDTGPGVKVSPSESKRSGIGLTNTRQRLDRLYGPNATLTLSNPKDGGCLVVIELPTKSHPTKESLS